MVREITADFVSSYMAGILSVLDKVNTDADGNSVPQDKRMLSLGLNSLIKYPGRSVKAILNLFFNKDLWRLIFWILKNALVDLVSLPKRLLPASWRTRYADIPAPLQAYAKYAEARLRDQRWTYLGLKFFLSAEFNESTNTHACLWQAHRKFGVLINGNLCEQLIFRRYPGRSCITGRSSKTKNKRKPRDKKS